MKSFITLCPGYLLSHHNPTHAPFSFAIHFPEPGFDEHITCLSGNNNYNRLEGVIDYLFLWWGINFQSLTSHPLSVRLKMAGEKNLDCICKYMQ